MARALMQARFMISTGDEIIYNPPFADPHKGEKCTVMGFPGEPDLSDPYWVEVKFAAAQRGEKTKFLPLRYMILNEERMPIIGT